MKDLNDELNANLEEIKLIEGGRLHELKFRNFEIRQEIALEITGLRLTDVIETESRREYVVCALEVEPMDETRVRVRVIGQELVEGSLHPRLVEITEKHWKKERPTDAE